MIESVPGTLMSSHGYNLEGASVAEAAVLLTDALPLCAALPLLFSLLCLTCLVGEAKGSVVGSDCAVEAEVATAGTNLLAVDAAASAALTACAVLAAARLLCCELLRCR